MPKTLHFKIAILHLLAVGVSISLFILFSHSLLRERLDRSLNNQLIAATTILERAVTEQATLLTEHLKLIQLDEQLAQDFRDAVGTDTGQDPRRLVRRLDDISAVTRVDVLDAYSHGLRFLYQTGPSTSCGVRADTKGVSESLAGEDILVLNKEFRDLVMRAMGPVRADGRVIGAISLGKKVNTAFLRSVSSMSQATLSLILDGELVATGLDEGLLTETSINTSLAERVAKNGQGLFGPVLRLGDQAYQSYYFPMRIAGSSLVAMAVIPRTRVDAAIRTASLTIVAWGSVLILVGIVIAYAFTGRITEPLQRLRDAAVRIAEQDYSVALPESGTTEIADVAAAFNVMAEKLSTSVAELRRSKEWAELLFKFSPSAIFTVDLEKRITTWNRRAEELTGYTAEEMLGQQCLTFAEAPCLDICGLFSPDVAKPVFEKECTILRKDGQRRVISKNVQLLRDADGNVVGGIETFIDITDRKKAEQDLREAKKQAESASEEKSRFLANMSHEIRTPMNGILGMSDLLMETDLSDEQRNYATMMRSSADALRDLINDVLDFSKIEAGRLDLTTEPFSVEAVLKGAVELLAVRAEEKGLRISWSMEKDVPETVVGDSGKIRQILLNLLGNAVKFTERGSVRVSVTRAGGEPQRPVLQFLVADTGRGIPPEDHSRIFEAFTQVDSSSARRFGGTGLGLSISKRLAERMGGTIRLESAVGKGSTFILSVPFDLPESSSGAVSDTDIQTTRPGTSTGPLTVLVAEDNLVNQTLAVRILEHAGHRPVIATNGREALSLFKRQTFDLVLMDVQMPEMDGLETTAAIREYERHSGGHVPIIAMTAHAMEGDRNRCLASGMDEYIAKPFQADELFSLIEATRSSGGAAKGETSQDTSRETSRRTVSDSVLDTRKALDMLDGDEDLYRKLISMFHSESHRRFNGIRIGIAQKDWQAVEREAHSLKSMALTIGGFALSSASEAVERAAYKKDAERLPALFESMEEVFRKTTDATEGLFPPS